MLFNEKTITLRDGRTAVFKSPELHDAAELLAYAKTAAGETEFLARCPEEWEIPLEREEAWIEHQRTSPDALCITCYIDGVIAGNCEISFNRRIKTAHRASIGIAILRRFWGLGIGSVMFEGMLAAAHERGVALVELEFVEGNDRARGLYEKYGFRVVAEIPDAFRLKDGTFRRGVFMQKRM